MPVKALVITSTVPPVQGRDVEGYYKRLSLLMRAVGAVADQVDTVHFVPDQVVAANADAGQLNRSQERYWGFPVSAHLIVRGDRGKSFADYYLKGVLSAAEQPPFYGVAGESQRAALAALLGRHHDLVLVHRMVAMCAYLATGHRGDNVVFDLDDVEHRVRLRASLKPPVQPGKLLALSHVPAIYVAERRGAARSQLTFVCSEADRRKLRRLGVRGVAVVPNAVHVPAAPPPLTREPTLLYLGDYGYEPNREAAERAATRILPLVRRVVPEARLLLGGKRPERLSRAAAAEPGVECLGFVDDIADVYARGRIVCCPLLNGGGTRVKLVEAAAYRKPIVSTRVGAEGLDFVDGEAILLADDDDAIAAACARLLGDDAACERIGEAARQRARREYEAGEIEGRIAGLLRGVIAHAVEHVR
jgi:glycosyltransferase involved in cell wall biosynthesis